jgi:hypothetical protein
MCSLATWYRSNILQPVDQIWSWYITRCLCTMAAQPLKGVKRHVDSFFGWTGVFFFLLSAAIKVIFQTSWVCHDDYGGHLRVISHDIDSMPIQRNVCPRHRFISCWHITGPSTGGLPRVSVPTDSLRLIPHLASRIPPPATYGLTTTPFPPLRAG